MNCLQCGNETKNPKFCNRSCCGKYMTSTEEFKKKLKESHPNKPLSKKHRENIKNGLLILYKKKRDKLIQTLDFDSLPSKELKRRLLKEEKGNKCEKCGYEYTNKEGKGPFQIHHKDGDNNNCHEKSCYRWLAHVY